MENLERTIRQLDIVIRFIPTTDYGTYRKTTTLSKDMTIIEDQGEFVRVSSPSRHKYAGQWAVTHNGQHIFASSWVYGLTLKDAIDNYVEKELS